MAKIEKNEGKCYLCKQTIPHRMIKRHLLQCLEKETSKNEQTLDPSEKEKIFMLKINAGPLFWLYLEVNGSAGLKDLDKFLRAIWLECCDHMSKFIVDGQYYNSDGGMNKEIHRTLRIGTHFSYEYDFGSTTELEGEVFSSRPGQLDRDISLIARNTLPADILCSCQKLPEVICSICYEFCCNKCREIHDCQDDEMMLPVVNSPRMGVCGYCGPDG